MLILSQYRGIYGCPFQGPWNTSQQISSSLIHGDSELVGSDDGWDASFFEAIQTQTWIQHPNSKLEVEFSSPGRGAPVVDEKDFQMHLHAPADTSTTSSCLSWIHVSPPCRPLHHWVFTINIGINSNFLTNFYQPLSWLFEQFQLLSLTGHSASPKNSCFPGNGLSDSRRQPTSCHELDVSPKRDAVLCFFFRWRIVRVIFSTGCWQQRPAAWNQQQEERIGIYCSNKQTNTYLHYLTLWVESKPKHGKHVKRSVVYCSCMQISMSDRYAASKTYSAHPLIHHSENSFPMPSHQRLLRISRSRQGDPRICKRDWHGRNGNIGRMASSYLGGWWLVYVSPVKFLK